MAGAELAGMVAVAPQGKQTPKSLDVGTERQLRSLSGGQPSPGCWSFLRGSLAG